MGGGIVKIHSVALSREGGFYTHREVPTLVGDGCSLDNNNHLLGLVYHIEANLFVRLRIPLGHSGHNYI